MDLFEELIANQRKKLLSIGRKIVPQITLDDVLQPNDYLELETDPLFRYEEGVLHGILAAQAAFRAERTEGKTFP